MKHVHLLIKPSSGMCNLACKYCFYHDIVEKREQHNYGFMEDSTLEAVIREGIAFAEVECTIAFQGGEPTLIGLDFFRKVVELQKKYNTKHIRINNAIQTNGTLLTAEWADFLKENHFLVGVSLDGFKESNDCNRIDAHDKGTFTRVMDAIHLLEERGVDFNVLTVVNRQTARKVKRIYNFYKQNNLKYLQFIPCLDPFGEDPGKMDYSLTPTDYGMFLNHLFDLWYQDITAGHEISIRQFENYVEMLLGYPPEACGMSGVCGMQHVVEADGSVYPCDFYVLDEYRLGNLNTDTLEQINVRRNEIRFIQNSAVVDPKCRQCRFYSLCRGGCRRNRLVNPDGSLGINYFCPGYEMFFEYAGPRLMRIARTIASQRRR